MAPKAFLFVCGPHTSGKTSVISALKAEGLIDYAGNEIGKELFYQRRFSTADQGLEFENEVLRLEVERDERLCAQSGVVAVETWHPGNLAYAAVRNPGAWRELVKSASRSPALGIARGLWLRVPQDVIRTRTTTFAARADWAAEFYARIDDQIGVCLEALSLAQATTVIDADMPFEDVLARVRLWIGSAGGVTAAPVR